MVVVTGAVYLSKMESHTNYSRSVWVRNSSLIRYAAPAHHPMMNLKSGLARLVKFGAVGVCLNLAGFAFFAVATRLGAEPVTTSIVGFLLTVLASHQINTRWVFKNRRVGVADYFVVYVAVLVLQSTFLWLLHYILGIPSLVAMFGLMCVSAMSTFIVLGRLKGRVGLVAAARVPQPDTSAALTAKAIKGSKPRAEITSR